MKETHIEGITTEPNPTLQEGDGDTSGDGNEDKKNGGGDEGASGAGFS